VIFSIESSSNKLSSREFFSTINFFETIQRGKPYNQKIRQHFPSCMHWKRIRHGKSRTNLHHKLQQLTIPRESPVQYNSLRHQFLKQDSWNVLNMYFFFYIVLFEKGITRYAKKNSIRGKTINMPKPPLKKKLASISDRHKRYIYLNMSRSFISSIIG
jgi:hypothetical protein